MHHSWNGATPAKMIESAYFFDDNYISSTYGGAHQAILWYEELTDGSINAYLSNRTTANVFKGTTYGVDLTKVGNPVGINITMINVDVHINCPQIPPGDFNLSVGSDTGTVYPSEFNKIRKIGRAHV